MKLLFNWSSTFYKIVKRNFLQQLIQLCKSATTPKETRNSLSSETQLIEVLCLVKNGKITMWVEKKRKGKEYNKPWFVHFVARKGRWDYFTFNYKDYDCYYSQLGSPSAQ